MAFKSERELLSAVLKSDYMRKLEQPGRFHYYWEVEPRGLFGIPDLVIARLAAVEAHIKRVTTFAFEAKLSNWKQGLVQAFRYRAFADVSFVIIDRSHLEPALIHEDEFRRANIGLISVDESGKILLHLRPHPEKPYSEHLEAVFAEMIVGAVNRQPKGASLENNLLAAERELER